MNTKIGAEIYIILWQDWFDSNCAQRLLLQDNRLNHKYPPRIWSVTILMNLYSVTVWTRIEKEKSLRHVAMVAKFAVLNNPWSCKYDVWLSCAWLQSGTKQQPILFFNRSTMQTTVSVQKDCWDPEILLPWQRDVTLLLCVKKPECRQIRSNVFRFIDNFRLRS